MSLPDGASRPRARLTFAGLAALAVLSAGCTVQPLYGTGPVSAAGAPASSMAVELASIEVAPVDNRVGLEMRNHLIFLLTGGGGRTENPRYRLEVGARARSTAAARIVGRVDDEPTSRVVTVTATYRLVEARTGRLVGTGTRSAMAAYDLSRQQFSALRAGRDAEDRGAREVAELIRMAVAADLSRRAPGS
jgi:LPS-assembly lipoprotein